ncbi:LD-carboxypeptidase [Actinomadura viridis]|uniref:Muramoyltetrapeptide carboxypeptidase LdcA involved in peptidoglycan recycling n=1 Tax=Actinomadura viridis TaxID=58110 RepID=A0A931GMC4_9ACTN|nr:S66 peptidase family protein [Actinomadura viridis]MBG6093048.1 muramoyltetrapeptide carboxypeptidase LdcA involved in peptidoglycan recycling [Actinomadura viridis]
MAGPVLERAGLLRPPGLRAGDAIGVVSPSGPGAPVAPHRFRRAAGALGAMGFEVREGTRTWGTGHGSGTPEERAAEINAFLRDPEVRAIVATIGGHTCNAILPLIDYAALRADPKIIVGYSDITALLLACVAKAGVVTFHGPTVMAEFGEFPEPLPYTRDGFLAALGRPVAAGPLVHPSRWTDEFLLWDSEDDRERASGGTRPWSWIAGGEGAGPLLGGNLDTMSVLAGTGYLPDFRGAVLLWETCLTSIPRIDQLLTHLEMAGVMDDLAGMIVGHGFRAAPEFEDALREHVAGRYAGRGFPVVCGVLAGHCDPMPTLPLGCAVALDADRGSIEVTDAAVR